jgi:nitrite reductase/ring-hydroxylating ferredoxin subunit
LGTTRSLIRWVIVGRRDGLRATIRQRSGCLAWLDRGGSDRAGEGRAPDGHGHFESSRAPSADRIVLAALDEVPPGTVIEVVGGDVALALANVDGELIAVDGVCPHAGGPLGDGHLDGCTLTCPWHGWSYDLPTGRSLVSNDVVLRRYPVEVIDGMVVLIEDREVGAAG